jgi:ketosteroid isomerase-like protein
MTGNKKCVEDYMEGFRTGDHAKILSCLTEDIEWEMPGIFHLTGKQAFDNEIENDLFVGKPTINITRMTEENDVVVAEGEVQSKFKSGDLLDAVFCDVFLMKNGRIKKLTTYQVNKTPV